MKPARYVLAYDLHYPEHDPAAWACVMDYVRSNEVDGFIFGGDQLDLSCISHHTAHKPLYRPQGALKSNLEGFNQEILDPLDEALGPKAGKWFFIGNHEAWLTEQLAEVNPELDGMISLEEELHLEERGFRVVPQGGFTKLGHLVVIHGDTIRAGMYSAKKASEIYAGSSIVLGHHHTLQVHTRSSPVAQTDRWTATVLPCLSTLSPTYGRKAANSWLQGFGIVYLMPSGRFSLNPVVILNGQALIEGEVYGRPARKKAA